MVTLDETKASRSCPGTYLGDLLLRPVGGVDDQRLVIHVVMNVEVIVVRKAEVIVVTSTDIVVVKKVEVIVMTKAQVLVVR